MFIDNVLITLKITDYFRVSFACLSVLPVPCSHFYSLSVTACKGTRYSSVFQPLCHDTLVYREIMPGVPAKMIIVHLIGL